MKLYLFLLLLFGLLSVFVLPSYFTYKRTKINPFVYEKEDNAHGYVGKIFKLMLLLLILTFGANLFTPDFYNKYLVSINYLENQYLFYAAFVILHLALTWILTAIIQMGNSWRIGIDEKNETQLVQNGLFSISRNPVFLGMIVALISAFFLLPNILTFFIAFAGYIAIQVQIRLEEEFLGKHLGTHYLEYKKKTKRLI